MHFNENAGRNQKLDKNGSLQWRATYPKYRNGDGILKPVRGPCTYGKSNATTINPVLEAASLIKAASLLLNFVGNVNELWHNYTRVSTYYPAEHMI